MMIDVFKNVHQEIIKLVPSSVICDIACFVFYDNHPKDKKKIDIVVCTKNGELKEFFQRDVQSSLSLNCPIKKPSELKIIRNNNSELFYLVATNDVLFLISSKEKLLVHKKLANIDRYEVNDTCCSGETSIKVIRKDDAVPLLFNGNFESLDDQIIIDNPHNADNSLPILNELNRKLVEARYSTKCNEKTYSKCLILHQKVSLSSYQNLRSKSNTVFENDSQSTCGALKLKTRRAWVKVCNKKIVIMLNIFESKESLENIQMLINHPTILSLVYKTKLFAKMKTTPYWLESNTHILQQNQEYVVVAVIDLNEIILNPTSRIELSGSISYKISAQEYSLPFEDVVVSSLESMGDEFDILSSCNESDWNTILAVLAAADKTELCLRHIKNNNEQDVSIMDLFCTHLQMERVGTTNNVIVYNKSPYHTLNGTLIVFHERNPDNIHPISVYTRSPSQIVALLHYIYDAVPAKVVATTPTYKISAKSDELSHYNEEILDTSEDLNYMGYATSILKRSGKILEYLDNSMIKMSESKNPSVQSKVGSHIDLFAGGVAAYKEFKQCVLEEAKKGVDSLIKSNNTDNTENEMMVID